MSISADVERGLTIHKEMDALKTELKAIDARLEKAGLNGPQIDLVDAEREGKQYLAKSDNHIVPVVFTADLLLKSFAANSKHHTRIQDAIPGGANAALHSFFDRSITYERGIDSGKKFRAHAADLLGKDAPSFITACLARDKHGIPKSAIKVEWDRASEVAA